MLYECNIESQYSLHYPILKDVVNREIINNDFTYFFNTLSFKINKALLDPYNYIINKDKSIDYYIYGEIINKYNINVSTKSCIFTNNVIFLKNISLLLDLPVLFTKNKLLFSKNKVLIHDYKQFFNDKALIMNTIIIQFQNFKDLFINILLAINKQKQDSKLIFNIPSTTSLCFLNLINFVLKYYNITVMKPQFTPIYDDTKYLICTKTSNNKDTYNLFISAMKATNYFIIENNRMSLYVSNKLAKENMIWKCYFLNKISQANNNNTLIKKYNQIFITKLITLYNL